MFGDPSPYTSSHDAYKSAPRIARHSPLCLGLSRGPLSVPADGLRLKSGAMQVGSTPLSEALTSDIHYCATILVPPRVEKVGLAAQLTRTCMRGMQHRALSPVRPSLMVFPSLLSWSLLGCSLERRRGTPCKEAVCRPKNPRRLNNWRSTRPPVVNDSRCTTGSPAVFFWEVRRGGQFQSPLCLDVFSADDSKGTKTEYAY